MSQMPRPPVLAIVSFRSGAGKTTLIEGIIKCLAARGYRVCAIKHSTHASSHDMDKDTGRFRQAGALASALLSDDRSLELISTNADLAAAIDALALLKPDLILCEGLKGSDLPKIAVLRHEELSEASRLSSLVAAVLTDGGHVGEGLVALPYDPAAVAGFIEQHYLRHSSPLVDPFGRQVLGIRVSLTQRCNLNCVYCHHEGESSPTAEMTAGEVIRILRVARDLGIRRVKFTGGEPLLREDLAAIISSSRALGLEDVAVTTNGLLLGRRARELSEAGLRRANVSIPSVDPAVYRSLTGGELGDVVEGLEAARKNGISVKLNTVMMRGINDSETERLIDFAAKHATALQLIELEDLNLDRDLFQKYHLDLSHVEEMLSKRAEGVIERGDMNRRRIYLLNGASVEVVRPVNNPSFCAACTRIRLTSDGKVKPCLMRGDLSVDLLGPIRSGCSDEELRALFISAVSLRAPFYR